MKIKIIKVDTTYKDLTQLAELFDQYRIFYNQESDIESARKFISDRINDNDSTIFVAYDENTNNAIGFAQLYPSFTSVGMQRIFILNDLYVKAEYRKKSVARKLIEQVHKFGMANGAKKITLMTLFDNVAAQALYETIGYKFDNGFKHYYFELPKR